jgi:hypothetical protein
LWLKTNIAQLAKATLTTTQAPEQRTDPVGLRFSYELFLDVQGMSGRKMAFISHRKVTILASLKISRQLFWNVKNYFVGVSMLFLLVR